MTKPNIKSNCLKTRGGDTREAAARNGKKVGKPTLGDKPLGSKFMLALTDDDDHTLTAFARLEGITKQDLIRRILSGWMAGKQIV